MRVEESERARTRKSERERERVRESENEREREGGVSMCVRVFERERVCMYVFMHVCL